MHKFAGASSRDLHRKPTACKIQVISTSLVLYFLLHSTLATTLTTFASMPTFRFMDMPAELRAMTLLSATNPSLRLTTLGRPAPIPSPEGPAAGDIEYIRFTHAVSGAHLVYRHFNQVITDGLSMHISEVVNPLQIQWMIRADPDVADSVPDPSGIWVDPARPAPADMFRFPQTVLSLLLVGAMELRGPPRQPHEDRWTLPIARVNAIAARMAAREYTLGSGIPPARVDLERGDSDFLAADFPMFLQTAARAMHADYDVYVTIFLPDHPDDTPLNELAAFLRDAAWLVRYQYMEIWIIFDWNQAHEQDWLDTIQSWNY
jgi:hypothetical protein